MKETDDLVMRRLGERKEGKELRGETNIQGKKMKTA